jgi:hypothetical protein
MLAVFNESESWHCILIGRAERHLQIVAVALL